MMAKEDEIMNHKQSQGLQKEIEWARAYLSAYTPNRGSEAKKITSPDSRRAWTITDRSF
jgi:hypothetical protein